MVRERSQLPCEVHILTFSLAVCINQLRVRGSHHIWMCLLLEKGGPELLDYGDEQVVLYWPLCLSEDSKGRVGRCLVSVLTLLLVASSPESGARAKKESSARGRADPLQ